MDIILTPTKLKGTIHSRPSAVSVCLNEIALRTAALRDPADAVIGSVCDQKDILSHAEIDPADMEAIISCLDSLMNNEEKINCGKSLAALYLTLPIAAATREKISFVGDLSLDIDEDGAVFETLRRSGIAFSKGNLKIRRRDRSKIKEIITAEGHLKYGHLSLNGKEDPWFLCGLLFALPLLEGNSSIRMTTLPDSSELAHMAVQVLKQYGIIIEDSVNEYGYPHYEIPGSQQYEIPDKIQIGRAHV